MTPSFDLTTISTIEFGVGRESGGDRSFFQVATNAAVKDALFEMAQKTFQLMDQEESTPQRYDPADAPADSTYSLLPLDDDLAEPVREIFDTANFEHDGAFPDDLSDVFCYFARFTTDDNRRLLCFRRAAQFKTIRKGTVLRFETDTLNVMSGRTFHLNNEFDVIVDKVTVHIIHPAGFKALAKVHEASPENIAANVRHIREVCPYIRWDKIESYAIGRQRIARLLASIRSAKHAENIDKSNLVNMCQRADIPLVDDGDVTVPDDKIQEFLEVLNRRRYEVELVESSRERYVASNRRPA